MSLQVPVITSAPSVESKSGEQTDFLEPTFWWNEIILPVVHFLRSRQDDDILHVMPAMGAAVVVNHQFPSFDKLDEPTATLEYMVESLDFVENNLDPTVLPRTVRRLATGFLFRFLRQRLHADLDYSIYLLEIVTQLLDTSTFSTISELHRVYFVLVAMHTIRYYLVNEPVHLDSLIGSFEKFLEETHGSLDYAAIRAKFSLGLVRGLIERSSSRTTRNARDCDRVLQLYDDIYPLVIGDMRRTWDRVRSLALRLLSRCGRKFHDLTGALECIRAIDDSAGFCGKEVLSSDIEFLICQLRVAAITGDRELLLNVGEEIKAPVSHYSFLMQLAAALALFKDDSDGSLNDTIRTLKDRCRACPEEDPCCKWYSIVLAMALLCRFERHHDYRDVHEARAFREPFEADEVFKVDLSLTVVSNTAISPSRWISPEDVKAWACLPTAFVRTSSALLDMPSRLVKDNPLLDAYLPDGRQDFSLIDALRHPGDDRKFHDVREWLLSLYQASDDSTEHLLKLCQLYRSRYSFTKQTEDLETSADYYLQALNDTNTFSHETLSLADVLFKLEKLKPGSVALSQLLDRFDFLLEAVHNFEVPVSYRLSFLSQGFLCFAYPPVAEQRLNHALEMGNLALSLIEQQCWVSPTPHASVNSRYTFSALFSIASTFIIIADPDNTPRAIEILEMGRSLLWNQLENLRTPVSELASVTPRLSTHFLELSRTLERRMGFSHEIGTDPLGTYHQELVEERNRIIEKIRALPGCENFLGQQSFDHFRRAASAEGPVVVLLPTSQKSLAVVFFHNCSRYFPLPITHHHLQRLKNSLSARSTSTARDPRAGIRPPKWKMDVSDVLKELWDRVAKPVIDTIEEMLVDGTKGKGRAGIPKLEERGRIWWCCVGEFSFMPMHAAGIYRDSDPICVSDYYISSYTPTLGVLVKARMRRHPTELKVLAAIQPNPGKGWSPLRHVQEELQEVVDIVPRENLISSGDSDQPDFEGTHTTVKNVVEKFCEATVLHLACHGTQDPKDPFKSGFVLANGEKLTIEEMIKHRLPNAHTAILSACHTSSNDAEQPDESINLAGALLHLGFSSILATKWPMHDSDGPLVAKAIYSELFNSSDLTRLHQVVNRQVNVTLHRNKMEASVVAEHNEDRSAVSRELLVAEEPQVYGTDGSNILDTVMDAALATIEDFKAAKFEARALSMLPLAEIIDAFARKLRQQGAPASRWATFVHVGV